MAIVEKRPAVYLSSKRTSNVYQRIVNFIFIIFPWWSNLTPPENSKNTSPKKWCLENYLFSFFRVGAVKLQECKGCRTAPKAEFPYMVWPDRRCAVIEKLVSGIRADEQIRFGRSAWEKNAKQKWKKTKKKHHLSVLVTFHRNPSIDHWVGGSLEKRSLDPHFSLVC